MCMANYQSRGNQRPQFFSAALLPGEFWLAAWLIAVAILIFAVLLWSGGLKGLQTGAILAAFPFVFVIIILIISLLKSFKEEVRRV